MADLFIAGRIASGDTLRFGWAMLPGEQQAEMYARGSLDGLLCDMQHGLVSYSDMVAMVRGVHRAGKPAYVRPPLDDFAMVSRALDAGAAAIVMPMINASDDARRLVAAAKYPPLGERSWGPFPAMDASGLTAEEYLAGANELTKVFGMVETQTALDNLEDICGVAGLDGVFVGPYDLSISLSGGAMAGAGHAGVQEALPRIVAAAGNAGKIPGIYASNADQVRQYADMGFRFISAANDRAIINAGLASAIGNGAN